MNINRLHTIYDLSQIHKQDPRKFWLLRPDYETASFVLDDPIIYKTFQRMGQELDCRTMLQLNQLLRALSCLDIGFSLMGRDIDEDPDENWPEVFVYLTSEVCEPILICAAEKYPTSPWEESYISTNKRNIASKRKLENDAAMFYGELMDNPRVRSVLDTVFEHAKLQLTLPGKVERQAKKAKV